MNRIVLVTNRNSSHAKRVYNEVIKPLSEVASEGNLIDYMIEQTSVADNIKSLSKIIKDDDLVISAGGDGTAVIAANAVLFSKNSGVTFGLLGYGNFNDIAGTFTGRFNNKIDALLENSNRTVDVYPLKIKVNGKLLRYSVLYTTIGLLAGAAGEFDKGKKRKMLKKGGANFFSSLLSLLPYYVKNKKTNFIPEYLLNDEQKSRTTDYIAVNGPRMAKYFRTGKPLYKTDKFLRTTLNVSRFIRTLPFVFRSLAKRMPGTLSDNDRLVFKKPTTIQLQTDGEYMKIKNVKTIEIEKSDVPLYVIKMSNY